ncbi:hypothetical protein J4H56_15890 [Vibrio alginolyticus]|uniref:MSHA operon transcriptional regulator n=1 Tax=Vibrio alginolyticus TaxID=663 RepID=UPI001BD47D1B|nr:hypothetical protein [Vibrio alginolyticus]MBS9884072.1 hypothetical protein [Vibrio alginolyticus]MCR9527670.1 hypothetical protein [Vibrio alginolyticus]MCZ6398242.1 hypothetical protein [Vibrio alginolyticus]
MDKDKFTNIYRLPGSIQIRIGKWQKTFRGTSDLVLHQALMERNKQFKKPDFLPKGWCVTPIDKNDITITHHGKYIQTVMRTMLDRKVSYKRLFLSRMSLEDGEKVLHNYKLEWVRKHNQIAKKYNQIKKKQYMNFAREEEETLYPSIPKGEFDKTLWNKLVVSSFGPQKKYKNPHFVRKADF